MPLEESKMAPYDLIKNCAGKFSNIFKASISVKDLLELLADIIFEEAIDSYWKNELFVVNFGLN